MSLDRRDLMLATLAVGLAALSLTASLPAQPLLYGVLNNFAHVPVFAALAVVLLRLLMRRGRIPPLACYALALAASVIAGGASEWLQPFIGRNAEWRDFAADIFGAVGGLALHVAFTAASRRRRLLAALLATAAIAPPAWLPAQAAFAYAARSDRFPALVQGGDWLDDYFLSRRGVEIRRTPLPDPWARTTDLPSRRIRIIGTPWPGIEHREPEPDWRAYTRLLVDVTNPDSRPLTLTLRVHDRRHDNRAADRFNRTFELQGPGRTTIELPLSEIERAPADRLMDMSQIGGIILFADGQAQPLDRVFYLTRVWLE